MASWTEQDTDSLLPGQPWTSAKALAAFENPKAIAEGASGSPTMQVAWHLLEAQTLDAIGASFQLSTDISAYRSVRLVGGAKAVSTNSATFSVDILIDGTWRDAFTGIGSQSSILLDVTIDRTDADDFKTVTAIVGELDSAAVYTQRTGGVYMNIVENAGPATAIRLAASGSNMTTATELNLYGIKRTAT